MCLGYGEASGSGDCYGAPPTGPQPHAVKMVNNEVRFAYDANGNMTQRLDENGAAWDLASTPENRLGSATDGTNAITFVYDADGMMVQRTENGQTTNRLGKLFEHNVTLGSFTKYYLFGGRLIAMREGLATNSPVSFFATDHLGSTSATLWANGSLRSRLRYDPWGKERYTLSVTPSGYRYTSQRWDSGLGLYDYNARYYDPALGKFISADTLVPDPAAPQAFNRYAYTLGNPLRYTDPTGHLTEEEMQNYFHFADKSDAINALGSELAGLLWNTNTTWGDVITYDGGNAMLALFERNNTTGNDEYGGGFWGLDGENAGKRVSRDTLKASDQITLNGDLAQQYRSGEKSLFVAKDSNYDYVTQTIRLGAGELGAIFAVIGVAALVVSVGMFGSAVLVEGGTVALSSTTTAATLAGLGSASTIGGFLVTIFGDTDYPRFYPTIRYDNLYYGNKASYNIVVGAPGY